MKFKLDENFGTRTQQLFRSAGHDIQTIRDQGMQECSDNYLHEVCCAEKRCLVTLDLDFSDVTRFPPDHGSGIIVIRVPHNPSITLLEQLVRQFLNTLTKTTLKKELWIVEVGRIRVHQSELSNESD
jgi:predicted nuclease of predicted toxin-antitoxin system